MIRERFQSCFLENELFILVGEMIMKDLYALRKGGCNAKNLCKAFGKTATYFLCDTCDYLEMFLYIKFI